MILTICFILSILVSSLLTIVLSYYQASIAIYQQILAILMVGVLYLYNRFFGSQQNIKPIFSSIIINLFVFLSSLFVQLLIVSSGGFYSPFFVLFHIFALGTSFLINLKVSVSFLILSLTTLVVSTWLSPQRLSFFTDDPGTGLIYITSLVVIMPIAYILSKKYHLKDQISKILRRQVQVGSSILESLSEVVLLTDVNLKIVSANEAIAKIIDDPDMKVQGRNLFDVLNLKNADGIPANVHSLGIDKVLADKTLRIISGFLLYSNRRLTPLKVGVQIKPLIDNSGKIEMLSFVISTAQGLEGVAHQDLDKALFLQQERLKQLKNYLQSKGEKKFILTTEFIDKTEQDILIVSELEDHPIKESIELVDLAFLLNEATGQKQRLASLVNVSLQFILSSDDDKEKALINLIKSNIHPTSLPSSDFAIPVNKKWVKILFDKLVDLAILLAWGSSIPNVNLSPQKTPGSVVIDIVTSYPNQAFSFQDIFSKYYGQLSSQTNLSMGSGLEGYIIKSITTQLNIPLSLKFNRYAKQLEIQLEFFKKAR